VKVRSVNDELPLPEENYNRGIKSDLLQAAESYSGIEMREKIKRTVAKTYQQHNPREYTVEIS